MSVEKAHEFILTYEGEEASVCGLDIKVDLNRDELGEEGRGSVPLRVRKSGARDAWTPSIVLDMRIYGVNTKVRFEFDGRKYEILFRRTVVRAGRSPKIEFGDASGVHRTYNEVDLSLLFQIQERP